MAICAAQLAFMLGTLGTFALHIGDIEAFEINWMTNTKPHHFGLMQGNSYTIKARTSENYSRVDWYVDGNFEWTESADGEDKTWSEFTHTYPTGTPEGRRYVVEARAYNIDETKTASKKRYLTVYAPSDSVEIMWVSIGTKNIVRKQGKTIRLLTDKVFSKVEWRVNDVLLYTDAGPSRRSRFWHYFDKGSEEGTEYKIEARAYPTNSNIPDSETKTVMFWADLELLWRSTTARVNGVTALGGSVFELSTSHSVSFYNDKKRDPTIQVKGMATWWKRPGILGEDVEVDKDGNKLPAHNEHLKTFELWPVFRGRVSFSLTQKCELRKGSSYAVQAYTNLLDGWDNSQERAQVKYPANENALEWFAWPDDGAPTTVGENTHMPVEGEEPPNGD